MPDNKNKNVKKANFLTHWWRGTSGELRKVTWPTPKEAISLTRVVIVVMIVMSAILGLFDLGFTRLISWLLKA
jgi:preprotein translocase subunit SecE